MRKGLILWVPLAACVLFVAVFAVSLNKPQDKAVHSGMVGQAVPEFTLAPAVPERPGLASAELRRGRPHVVNVFASWCVPCRAESQQLAALASRDIPVVGIAVRDRPEDLAAFLGMFGNPFTAIGADSDRRVQMTLGSAGVPETFVVDGRGIIRLQHIGAVTDGDIAKIAAAYEAAR